MKKSKFITLAVTIVLSVFLMVGGANALPMIGFDPTGTGTSYIYSDVWTNFTDSGLSVGFVPLSTVPVPDSPYLTDFLYQARIAGTQSLGAPNTPTGLNSSFELTLTLQAAELVVAQGTSVDITGALHDQAAFEEFPTNGPAGTATLYFDDFTAGVQADPNVVSGYTDGIPILTASLIDLTGSFDGILTGPQAGTGTGSFQTLFLITGWDPNYIDLSLLPLEPIIGVRASGDTKLPPTFLPGIMFDGTSTTSGILLKTDASETFVPGVPEPSALLMLGSGLLGFGAWGIYRKRKK